MTWTGRKCNPEYSIWSEPPPLCEMNANRDKLVEEIKDLNPVQLFELFFDDTVLRHIVDHPCYMHLKILDTKEEMKSFINSDIFLRS
ncbi:unnamed protein product [Acanthoscelides obtectus]|uniref:Uncharacterized protein n=1 Tax=Acanthoscelides obtectus TaxID=200917 RepID=A0A9P0QD58_ACAOB|nr:unnamed protein product [Acanthoscelides obtectus]CAK1633370.1 hypothetical protein AOBTE_LOCUS8081 [Acanthoscelides obtectus]